MSRTAMLLLLLALSISTSALRADGVLISWSPQMVAGASQASFDEAKKLAVPAILEKNRTAVSWPAAYHVLVAADAHRDDRALLAGLAEQVANGSEQRLADT